MFCPAGSWFLDSWSRTGYHIRDFSKTAYWNLLNIFYNRISKLGLPVFLEWGLISNANFNSKMESKFGDLGGTYSPKIYPSTPFPRPGPVPRPRGIPGSWAVIKCIMLVTDRNKKNSDFITLCPSQVFWRQGAHGIQWRSETRILDL